MKYFLRNSALILLCIFFTKLSYGKGINFFKGSWLECVETAKRENKAIFIDAYTDWCGWCVVMDKKTFTDPILGDYFSKNIIAYKMDMEEGIGIKFSMKYRISSYPSYLFFNSKGDLIGKEFGYQEPVPFLKKVKLVLDSPIQRKEINNLSNLELPFPDFFVRLHGKGKEKKWPPKDTILSYLKNQTNLFSEINWSIISRLTLDSTLDQFVLDNRNQYGSLYGKDEVNTKISRILFRSLSEAVKDSSDEKLFETLNLVNQYMGDDAKGTKLFYQTYFYEKTNNWNDYVKIALEFVAENGYENHSAINEYSWSIYKNVSDQGNLKMATKWMKNIVSEHYTYMYLDTYAALLYKIGDLENAEKITHKAIYMGLKDKEDISETLELQKKIKKAKRKK